MVAQTIPEDRPLTVDDFFALPEDGERYQLIMGELIVPPPPEINHQLLVVELTVLLHSAVRRADFGKLIVAPAAVVISHNDVVEPDLFIVRNDQLDQLSRQSFNGAPSIVFEVLSPSNRRVDLQRKAVLYATAGVEEYWIIDPHQRRILIQHGSGDRMQTAIITTGEAASLVLPGLIIDLDTLFGASDA